MTTSLDPTPEQTEQTDPPDEAGRADPAAEADRAGGTPPDDPPAATSSGDARSRVVLLAVLVAVAVVCLVALVLLFVQRTDSTEGSFGDRVSALVTGDDPVQDERDQVMSQASQFMLRVNTYGPDLLDDSGQMPDYRAGVEEVITPKFQASFEQGVTAAEQTVAQAGVAREAEVFSTGVSSLDGDSARVLVAGSFVNSYPDRQAKDPDARIESEPAPFRVEVSLVRTDGEWLVDDFVPVTGVPDEQSGGTTPAPTQPPQPQGGGSGQGGSGQGGSGQGGSGQGGSSGSGGSGGEGR